jgi:hypothetical protein
MHKEAVFGFIIAFHYFPMLPHTKLKQELSMKNLSVSAKSFRVYQ